MSVTRSWKILNFYFNKKYLKQMEEKQVDINYMYNFQRKKISP